MLKDYDLYAFIICIIIICIILLCIYKMGESNYIIYEYPHFLTDAECDAIINYSNDKLVISEVYRGANNETNIDERKSRQCWITDDDTDIANYISNKVANITSTKKEHQEHLQVVRYDEGGHFIPHHDACVGNNEFCNTMNSFVGPRYITFLIYLNDNFEGGHTNFPNINKSIIPQKGKAVLFYNVNKDGSIISESLHQGSHIINGTKWIANKWIRLPS